jgi:hypothetical protein
MRVETWAAFRIHSRLKMPGSSEKDRPLADPCISQPPPRCYDPDPLRSLSAAYFPEILKGRRLVAGAEVPAAMYRVVSDYRKLLERKVDALPFAMATELAEPPESPTLDLTK